MRQRSVPEELMPSIISAVGLIVVNWTFVENNLDYWAAILYHNAGGSDIERKLPKQLTTKISFLEKCFDSIPELEPHKAVCVEYLSAVTRLKQLRHFVVHGVLADYDADSDASITFAKIDFENGGKRHVVGELTIPGVELVRSANELLVMAKIGQEVANDLMKTFVTED